MPRPRLGDETARAGYVHSEETRAGWFRGSGPQSRKRGALDAFAGRIRLLSFFHLVEYKPENDQFAWDSGLIGRPHYVSQRDPGVTDDPPNDVIGTRDYGKDPKGKQRGYLFDNRRRAYCYIRKWATDHGYPTLSTDYNGKGCSRLAYRHYTP